MAVAASTTRIGCRSPRSQFLTFHCVRMKCVGWIADARGYDCDCCDCDCDCDDEGDVRNASAASAVNAVSVASAASANAASANGHASGAKTRSR